MKKINKRNLDTAYEYIRNNCERIYRCRFEYNFMNGDPKNVTAELKKYQNDDGGFGGGLEPDFLLPESSPMATTISFQILDEIEVSDDDLIKKAIHYFEKAYNSNV